MGKVATLRIAGILSGLLSALPLHGQPPSTQRETPGSSSKIPAAAETEVPYNQQPINYSQASPTDPVARLKSQLERGEIKLEADGESGVLAHVLRVLNVPASSQLLVFSKSSANAKLIQPKTPRAIYFNDEVYVGWVPGSAAIELSAADASLGGTFYSLPQTDPASYQIRRDASCLLCHLSRSTLRVPGHVVRSFTTDALGELRTGWSRITHDSPYEKRWAGWYVTGPSGVAHLGNVFGGNQVGSAANNASSTDVLATGKLTTEISATAVLANVELPRIVPRSRYLSSESDLLPHLVLDHQAHGHNLITRLNYEVRLERPITALEPLVRYLLFLDEPPLPSPIEGNAEYRRWFESRGRRDQAGRSLREFDLQTRLFKYRLSYLVDSAAFRGLPESTQTEINRRLKACLTTTDPQHAGARIPMAERQAILQIWDPANPE